MINCLFGGCGVVSGSYAAFRHLNDMIEIIISIDDRVAECNSEIEYLQNKDTLYLSPLERIEQERGYYEDILNNKPRRHRLVSFVKRIN